MKLTYKHTRYACYATSFTSAIINNFTPLLFATLSETFGITTDKLGLLVTVNFVTQILMDLIGAKFAEKIGCRRIMLISQSLQVVGLAALGTLPFVFGNSYVGLVIAVIMYAMGGGLNEAICSSIFEALPTDDDSSKLSIMHSFYCWGSMVVVIVSALYFWAFGVENWRYLAYGWSAFCLISVFMFSVVPIVTFAENTEKLSTGKLFSKKLFWIFLILMLCSGSAELAVSQWASMFAEKGLGISKTLGDIIGPCLFAFTMGLSRVIYGIYSSRWKLTKFIMISTVLCIISYAMISMVPDNTVAILGCALCGFSVGVMWPGVISLAAQKMPEGGTPMFGFLAMAGDVGCSVGPYIVGLIAAASHDPSEYDALRSGLFTVALFPIILLVFIIILQNMRSLKERKK